MELQKTFKESYTKELRDAVKSGENLSKYKDEHFDLESSKIKRLANLYEPYDLGQKLAGLEDDDFKAAIVVYEAYKDITLLIASNESFWAYLTHTSMFNYTQKRWPKVFEDSVEPDYILDHWFFGKSIFRNAAASLWWTVHNTVDEERQNKYELTSIMFKNYTLRTMTFGTTSLIRHREAMIGILEFLLENPEITDNYFENRGRFISKYFNLLGAVKQLASLDRHFFKQKCEKMKDKILSITTREQVEHDDSLYND